MSKDTPSAPPPRDLGQELQQILGQAGPLYQSQATYSPLYTGLDLSNLKLALEGTPGGTKTVKTPSTVSGWMNVRTGQRSQDKPSRLFSRDRWVPTSWEEMKESQVTTEATPGFLDILESTTGRLGTMQNAQNTAARQATYQDLRTLNPGQSALMDSITGQAQQGLDLGSQLDPAAQRQIRNAVLGESSARGWGLDPASLGQYAMTTGQAGETLRQQRLGNAQQAAQLNNALYTLPAVGYAPNTLGLSQSVLGQGGAYGQQPSILQQLGGYGSDLFNTNYNADAAARIASANANNAAWGNAAQLGGTLGAAWILGCWVAREVYGEENPRWMEFRTWLSYHAPEWLRRLYLRRGEAFAGWLRRHGWLKPVIQVWMDGRIRTIRRLYTPTKEEN